MSRFLLQILLLIHESKNVNNYPAGEGGLYHSYIGMALEYTDKDTLVRVLSSIKEIPEKLRDDYIPIIQKKSEMDLSANANRSLTTLLQKIYNQATNIGTMAQEDAITEGFVANLMCAVKEINNDKFLIKMSGSDNKFSIDELDSDFAGRSGCSLGRSRNGHEFQYETIDSGLYITP